MKKSSKRYYQLLKILSGKKKQGFFTNPLGNKLTLARYYEDIRGDKKSADQVYVDIENELKKPLKRIRGKNELQAAKFLLTLQEKETGSFVEHPTTLYIEIEAARHMLKTLKKHGLKPRYPLKFLNRVDTGRKLRDCFFKLLHSYAEESDKELNLIFSSLPALKESGFHKFSNDWEDAYWKLIRIWQDKKTGYWGPWVKKRGKLRKLPSLSTTFHIIRMTF